MNAVDECREYILSKLAPLEAESQELDVRQNELQDAIAKLKGSLAKFDELPSKAHRKPAVKASKAKPSNPDDVTHAKKPDIEPVCLAKLKANPRLTLEGLKSEVEAELVDVQKFSRNGIALGVERWWQAHRNTTVFAQGPLTAKASESPVENVSIL
jgi:hypothetical protein